MNELSMERNRSIIIPRMVTIATIWLMVAMLLACTVDQTREKREEITEAPPAVDIATLREDALNGNKQAWLTLGSYYAEQGDAGGAFKWLCPLTSGNNAEANYWLGKLYEAQGDEMLALSYFEKARKFGYGPALQGKVRMMKGLSPAKIEEGLSKARKSTLPCGA